MLSIEEIKEELKKRLSEKRYLHCVGTGKRARELAIIHKYKDPEKAEKAGLAHDIAKELSKEEKIEYCKENNIPIKDIEYIQTGLLHGKIGADIAKKKLGFDEEMQEAIYWHTTGRKNMTLLDKIVYAADKTEETRTKEKGFKLDEAREIANNNIDEAVVFMLGESICYNIQKGKLVDPDSIEARNDLIIKNQ